MEPPSEAQRSAIEQVAYLLGSAHTDCPCRDAGASVITILTAVTVHRADGRCSGLGPPGVQSNCAGGCDALYGQGSLDLSQGGRP